MCFDGVKRLCHIRGKLRKKVWINQSDIILVGLRDYQDARADVILKYSADEARNLKSYGEFPKTVKINETVSFGEEGIDDDIEFDDVESSDEEDIGVDCTLPGDHICSLHEGGTCQHVEQKRNSPTSHQPHLELKGLVPQWSLSTCRHDQGQAALQLVQGQAVGAGQEELLQPYLATTSSTLSCSSQPDQCGLVRWHQLEQLPGPVPQSV